MKVSDTTPPLDQFLAAPAKIQNIPASKIWDRKNHSIFAKVEAVRIEELNSAGDGAVPRELTTGGRDAGEGADADLVKH